MLDHCTHRATCKVVNTVTAQEAFVVTCWVCMFPVWLFPTFQCNLINCDDSVKQVAAKRPLTMWKGEKQKTRTDHPLPDCIETFWGGGGYPLNKQKFAYFLPWDHKIVFLFYCLLFKPLWWKGMTGKHQLCWKQNHVSVQDFTSLAVNNHHTEQKQTHNSLKSGH